MKFSNTPCGAEDINKFETFVYQYSYTTVRSKHYKRWTVKSILREKREFFNYKILQSKKKGDDESVAVYIQTLLIFASLTTSRCYYHEKLEARGLMSVGRKLKLKCTSTIHWILSTAFNDFFLASRKKPLAEAPRFLNRQYINISWSSVFRRLPFWVLSREQL